jgi:hypothetical protein
MKLWLDDQRSSPKDNTWVRVLTAVDAIAVLATGAVEECSLDYDIKWSDDVSEDWENRQTGYAVVSWMRDHKVWPAKVTIHSSNKTGRTRMLGVCYGAGIAAHDLGGQIERMDVDEDFVGFGLTKHGGI